MKKSTKFFCIISILFIVIGLILCGIAYGFGSNFQNLSQIFTDSKIFSYLYRNNNQELDKDALIWESTDSSIVYYFLEVKGKENPITSIEIDCNTCKVIFKAGEKLEVKVLDLQATDLTCRINRKGIFQIKDSSSFGIFNIFNRKRYTNNGTLEITLPESLKLENFSCNNNIGSINITENFIKCENLKIDNHNGEISIEKLSSNQSEIHCNYGTVYLAGEFLNDTKIDCKSGNIEIYPTNSFSYLVDTTMGNVVIKGNNFSNSSKKTSTIKQTNNFDITCSLGYVNIN